MASNFCNCLVGKLATYLTFGRIANLQHTTGVFKYQED
jgi:hypothetical protein